MSRPLAAALLAILLGAGCGAGAAGRPPSSGTPTPDLPGVLVTRADDRGTVHAPVGGRVQIALGTEYEWRLDPPDGIVLMRGAPGDPLVRGTQAIWTAASPGASTITATGTVICPSGRACVQIALLFTTTVVVDR